MADDHLGNIDEQGILLESGTNELEIVEFIMGGEYYGINVAKVREIIRSNVGIVPVPDTHESIAGCVNLRGQITPVINLAKHFKINDDYDPRKSRIIVAEFNRMRAGFWVNAVTRIHRLSWTQVESPSHLINSKQSYTVGVVKIEDRVIFLIDFEKIAAIINPKAGIQEPEKIQYAASKVTFDRSKKTVLVAEDSPFISQMIVSYLQKAGYQTQTFRNGLEAWSTLEKLVNAPDFKRIDDTCHLLITDIEMPQMDGLHLLKRVRETEALVSFPCIVFSSMISDELSEKCRALGADGQITKPEIEGLVNLVDTNVL